MSGNMHSSWLSSFNRECVVRRSVILHGNVNDLFLNPDSLDYEPSLAVAVNQLKRRGFDEVVVWDRFSGIDAISPEALEELRGATIQRAPAGKSARGETYDLGLTDESGCSALGNGGCDISPEDFFAMVYHAMVGNGRRRYAFVIDWTHYLFGNANALSEKERHWLLALSKAIRNAPTTVTKESVGKPDNLVVLVCAKVGGVPPSYYQKNPRVKDIVIPLPDRTDREAYLKQNLSLFKLQNALTATDPKFNDLVDMLDGFTLMDMQQLVKLSHHCEPRLDFEKLVNLYKYGEKDSPWENLSKAKLLRIESTLQQWVKGQNDAVSKVACVIKRAYTGLSGLQTSRKQRAPKGVLFFVGPTGVGKTELAKALARFLFGDEDACIRFDMSEFNHEHADQRLIGAPPGYVGYEEGGQLTNAVKERPFSVLLFDEIEKADGRILDKFLQILEDGRLTDGKGETVYFSETVIIFTSNIGSSTIDNIRAHEGEDLSGEEFKQRVRGHFVTKVRDYFVRKLGRPELLNRIGDNIVPFNFIVDDTFMIEIAKAKLVPLKEALKEKYRIEDIYFANENKALSALVSGVDRSHGGRGILNEIVPRIIDPLAAFLFEAEDNPIMYAGRKVRVVQAGNAAKFDFELE